MNLFGEREPIKVPQNVIPCEIDPYSNKVSQSLETLFSASREIELIVHLDKYKILACGLYKETRDVFLDQKRIVSSRSVGIQDFKRSHGDHRL